jgi:predicted ribosome-associated RNA-binding protein Tma20
LYPDLCSNVFIKEGVEAFIFKGAHLMWPGVENVDSVCRPISAQTMSWPSDGQPTRSKSVGLKRLVAVGALACDIEGLKDKERAEGIACYILHLEGDQLWNSGPEAAPGRQVGP